MCRELPTQSAKDIVALSVGPSYKMDLGSSKYRIAAGRAQGKVQR